MASSKEAVVERLLLAVVWVAVMAGDTASNPAMAKGGTNAHEMASEHRDIEPGITDSIGFTGCGRGRYRDSRTHKCVGPADVGR